MTNCIAVLWSIAFTFAPLVRVHWFARRIIGDEMRVTLHTCQSGRGTGEAARRLPPAHNAELQAGRAALKTTMTSVMANHSAVSGSRMVGSRASALAYSAAAAAE